MFDVVSCKELDSRTQKETRFCCAGTLGITMVTCKSRFLPFIIVVILVFVFYYLHSRPIRNKYHKDAFKVKNTSDQHGKPNYQNGEINYQHGEINYQHGEINYQHGEINYQHGETSYQHGEVDDQHELTNPKVCQPKENITFMKIHKTGSTTVQNILLRYADNHDLHVVLPKTRVSFNYPTIFQKKFIIESPNGLYNILCYHMRYNPKVVTELMPPNSVYITILRDPITHYESFFTYFNIGKSCKIKTTDSNSLNKFFSDPKKCYKNTRHNFMLYDLGMTEKNIYDEKEIQSMIDFMVSKFSLVLIMEYIEESILLLKDLLCWDLEDVSYFTLNARKDKSVHKIDDVTKQKIYDFNSGDVKLYEHFNRTFWRKAEVYGKDRMAEDVKKLQEMNEKLSANCLRSPQDNGRGKEFKVYQPPGVQMDNKVLNPNADNFEDCKRRVYPERDWLQYLKEKQFPEKFPK